MKLLELELIRGAALRMQFELDSRRMAFDDDRHFRCELPWIEEFQASVALDTAPVKLITGSKERISQCQQCLCDVAENEIGIVIRE